MRLQHWLYLAVALVVAVGLSWSVAVYSVASIETDTIERLEKSLGAAGDAWVEVEADGLRVVLTGTSSKESERVRMLETVAQVVNTSRIVDETTVERSVARAQPAFSLEILRHHGDLSLIGLIPGRDARVEVLRATSEFRDPNSFSDFLEAVEYPAPDGWSDALQFALRIVGDLDRSHLIVRPGGVEVEAFLDSQAHMEAMRSRLTALNDGAIKLRLSLRAPKAVVAPFLFEAELADGQLQVAECSSDSERAQIAIYSAFSEFGIQTDCELALGSPSENWASAVAETLNTLRILEGGTVRIEDTDVVLTGPLGMDPVAFSVGTTKLETALPAPFSLTSVLPSKPKPRVVSEVRPPELKAVSIAEGQVTIEAPFRNELALEAGKNFALARFGSNRTETDFRIEPDLPQGWSAKALAAIDALSLLHAGEIHLDETGVNVFGVTARKGGAGTIKAIFQGKFDSAAVTIDVAFDESLVQKEDEVVVLTDDACERALASIMREFQITFAPSSATIDEASLPVIDEIAAVLKTCPDASFEVGGHTDSQGRESMNLGLSQARAEAVLDALLDRDVLLQNLAAKGYGEMEPIADNGTEEGRAANRRIAFKLVAAAPPEEEDLEGEDEQD